MASPVLETSLPKPWAVWQPVPTMANSVAMQSRATVRMSEVIMDELCFVCSVDSGYAFASFFNMGCIPLVIAATVLVGCDKPNAVINAERDADKSAIDTEKKAVDAAAVEAKKQTDVEAAVDKAKIEAKKVAEQAELDADKKKADAQAELEKGQAGRGEEVNRQCRQRVCLPGRGVTRCAGTDGAFAPASSRPDGSCCW